MNEHLKSISRLYEPDNAPVVGVSGGSILFCNSAARSVFPGIAPGIRASQVLPDPFMHCDNTSFVTTASVFGQAVSAVGVWQDTLLLLRMNMNPPEFQFSPDSFSSGMLTDLAAVRIALTKMTADLAQGVSEDQTKQLACLRHSYYKMLRRSENISLAYNLTHGIAVFKPLLVNPIEWLAALIALMREPAEREGVKLQFSRPSDFGAISLDRDLLEHMVLNLVSNALRHTSSGGTITFRLSRPGRWLLLAVEDTGPGFPDDQLGALYQRSVLRDASLRVQHDHLGLLIVWGIADLHGGSVTITNRVRGGASVRILLPTEQKGQYNLRSPSEPYRARYPENEQVLTELADVLPDEYYSI